MNLSGSAYVTLMSSFIRRPLILFEAVKGGSCKREVI